MVSWWQPATRLAVMTPQTPESLNMLPSRLRPLWKQPTIRINCSLAVKGDNRVSRAKSGCSECGQSQDSKMSDKETIQVAKKISGASRQIEETAVRVAQKRLGRSELTSKVSDSAAELSNYILKRARTVG